MGLKHGSSRNVGVVDVARVMAEFERSNSCILSLSFTATMHRGLPDLIMTGTAYTANPVIVDRVPLASYQFSLAVELFSEMNAAVLFCLYMLDSALMHLELDKLEQK